MKRCALLIGVQKYGDGFPPLSVVGRDVDCLAAALKKAGFSTTTLGDNEVQNASTLHRQIVDFCNKDREGTAVLIYFSGHGIFGDGDKYYLVPPGVSRAQAKRGGVFAMPFLIHEDISDSAAKIILFVIDACRDRPPKAPAESNWKELERADTPIYLLGCGPGEMCHVIEDDQGEISLFTKSLVDILENAPTPLSIRSLSKQAEERCAELGKEKGVGPQNPRTAGEFRGATTELLDMPLFDGSSQPVALSPSFEAWPFGIEPFAPDLFHCFVVRSEHARHCDKCSSLESPPVQSLVNEALDEVESDLGKLLEIYWRSRLLLSGTSRAMPQRIDSKQRRVNHIFADEVFTNDDQIKAVVRGIIEADLVVFDVTEFEPAVMFLLGLRSAVRRGVTICTAGAEWLPGTPLTVHGEGRVVPFNLQDISLTSHAYPPNREPSPEDPVVKRLAIRIREGFRHFVFHPDYLDLPSYQNVRRATATNFDPLDDPLNTEPPVVSVKEKVVVFCPFSPDFTQRNLDLVRAFLKRALRDHQFSPDIVRVLELPSPRLVSQLIDDSARRFDMCVVDWTNFSPSVFMELGVRLGIHEKGALQIMATRGTAQDQSENSSSNGGERQRQQLIDFFRPTSYRLQRAELSQLADAVSEFLKRDPTRDGGRERYRGVYDAVLHCLPNAMEASEPIELALIHEADMLAPSNTRRAGGAEIAFRSSQEAKRNAEEAAVARRVAAWLYLEYRVHAGELDDAEPMKQIYLKVGQELLKSLFKKGRDKDRQLALNVRKRLKEIKERRHET